MSAPDVRPVGTPPLPDYTETRAFAESLSDDLGPMFGRDVVRLIDALEAVTTERDEALKSRDLWRENGYDLADHHDELRAERDALAAQVATLRGRLSAHAEMEDCGQCRRAVREAGEALSGLVEQPGDAPANDAGAGGEA